jgi:hypothetical protein
MDKTESFAKEEPPNLGFKYYTENYQSQKNKIGFDIIDVFSGYKDKILNEKYLNAIASSYKELVTLEEIGQTKTKNQILALRITNQKINDNQKISVLVNCAIHANEVITTDHCYDVIYNLLTNKKLIEKYLDKLVVWVIPIANPDGAEAFWNISHLQGRKNLTQNNMKGVDLNRNFPFHWGKTGGEYSSNKIDSPYYQGPMEASEPETQSLLRLIEKERFAASISYHAFANSLLFPYSVEGFLNPSPDLAEIVGKKIAKNVKTTHPSKQFYLKKNLYPIDGVDQDFYYYNYGTLAYVLESSHLNPDYKYVPKIVDSFRIVWIRLLDELVSGEKILLRIQDETGMPLYAKLNVKSLTYFQGEVRYNHPTKGIFYLYYVPSLKGEIQIESEGYEQKTIKVRPKSNWEIETVTLRKIN